MRRVMSRAHKALLMTARHPSLTHDRTRRTTHLPASPRARPHDSWRDKCGARYLTRVRDRCFVREAVSGQLRVRLLSYANTQIIENSSE